MALELKPIRVELTVALNGEEITVYARRPTASEHVSYRKGTVDKRGRMRPETIYRNQVKHGLELLTGIREGDLTVDGQPLSEKTPGWREELKNLAPQIPAAVALAMFEGAAAELDIDDDDDDEDGGDEESPHPLVE